MGQWNTKGVRVAGTVFPEPSLARESEKDACDINRIMSQYERTGMLPQVVQESIYLDVSEMGDYREAVEKVRLAEGAFMALPASVRSRFQNDPAAFVDFCEDPENRKELEDLGLVEKAAEAPPVAPAAPAAGGVVSVPPPPA